MGQLRTIEADLEKLGYQIIAIGTDKPEKVAELEASSSYGYTLLSDSKLEAALAFGLAFRLDDDTVERLKGFDIDLEAAQGETHHLLPVPAVYVVDRKGKIHFEYVNPDYHIRIDAQTVLAAARAAARAR